MPAVDALPAVDAAPAGLTLLSGSATGTYAGTAFTVVTGLEVENAGDQPTVSIILSTASDLSCAVLMAPAPPIGFTTVANFPTLASTKAQAAVYLMFNVTARSLSLLGEKPGTVTVISTTPTSTDAVLAFDFTDTANMIYNTQGEVEVTHCATPPPNVRGHVGWFR